MATIPQNVLDAIQTAKDSQQAAINAASTHRLAVAARESAQQDESRKLTDANEASNKATMDAEAAVAALRADLGV